MSRFDFNPQMPKEVRGALEPLLAEYAWLVPAWCRRVTVRYYSDSDDSKAAETEVNYTYRWACIDFFPDWLNGDDSRRRDNVIHELIHLHTNRFADLARNMVEDLSKKDNPQFYDLAEHDLRAYHESVVQDLTFVLLDRLAVRSKVKGT